MVTEEHRRFPRIPAQATLLVESLDPNGPESLTRTRSVSRGGVGFLSPAPLDENTSLRVLISVGNDVVKARGRVVYCEPAGDGRGHEVGVEFLQIDPQDEAVFLRLLETASNAPGDS